MTKDPPIPKNGKCAVCGKTHPDNAIKDQDPFCSTNCCRTWYTLKESKAQ